MREEWRRFRMAGNFLTILPVGRRVSGEAEDLARSMAFFPLVGLVLGVALVVCNWVLEPVIPRSVLDCLLVLALISVTGALHLDGIADVIDGLAGGRDREGALRIMKDSRVGAMGVIGLVMVLLLKYLALLNLPAGMKSAGLVFFPAAGRWMQVVLAAFCRYARAEGGTGAAFIAKVGEREWLVATGTLVLAALALFGMNGFFLLFLLGVGATLLIRYFQHRLGGITGDVLGAATEMTEVLTLLLILAIAR